MSEKYCDFIDDDVQAQGLQDLKSSGEVDEDEDAKDGTA